MLKISDKISAIALSAVLGVAAFNTQAGFNPNQPLLTNENAITESIIIKFKNNQILSNVDITSVSGLELKPQQKMSTGAQVFQVQSKTMSMLKSQDANNAKKQFDAMLKKLNSNPAIKYAVRNIKVHALQVPNDSRYSEQWHYYEPAGGANLEGAWDITTGKNVNVGVIDTGIVNHENLEGQILPGQNFADGDNTNDDPTDHGIGTHYHGTHVSGTIAANSNHHHVVSGIAWDAKVVPVRVLGDGGSGTFDAVIDGMLWAANAAVDQNVNDGSRKPNQNPVDVMNLSLGGSGDCNVAMQEAVDKIISKGTVIVVAAGNESRDAMYSTPANCKGVITVGATGRSGTQAYYTNTGSLLDIAAPGGDQMFGTADGVLSTTGPGQYEFLQGTSMATPHIVGIVALMRSVNPDLSAKEISEILRSTARGNELGVGLVDATAAVQEAKSRYENKRKIA